MDLLTLAQIMHILQQQGSTGPGQHEATDWAAFRAQGTTGPSPSMYSGYNPYGAERGNGWNGGATPSAQMQLQQGFPHEWASLGRLYQQSQQTATPPFGLLGGSK